ncbi:MAG: HD domain-containing protein [Bacilli bacterium]
MKINIDSYFSEIAHPIIDTPEYKSMKKFVAHGPYSVYDHCLRVTIFAYSFAKSRYMNIDYEVLIRGSLLHDFYLYDWHKKEKYHSFHGFKHPVFALFNASRKYKLKPKEMNMIRSHMFPLTLLHIPLSKEAWILCYADKVCAYHEHQAIKKIKKDQKSLKKAEKNSALKVNEAVINP